LVPHTLRETVYRRETVPDERSGAKSGARRRGRAQHTTARSNAWSPTVSSRPPTC